MNPKKKPLLTTVFIGINAEYKSNTPLPDSNTGTYARTHICTIMIATPSHKAMGSVCVCVFTVHIPARYQGANYCRPYCVVYMTGLGSRLRVYNLI